MPENVAVMSGKATKRIVVSRNVASTASEAIISVRREWSYMRSAPRGEPGLQRLGHDRAVPQRDAAVLDGEAAGAVVDLEAADEPTVVREA